MIFTKKDVRIIGVLLAVLLMLICDGLSFACPPPDCPPCYAWNGERCVYTCVAASCQTCVNGACIVCGGSANKFCCNGNCCDWTMCKGCVNGMCQYRCNLSLWCETCMDGICRPCLGNPDKFCCNGNCCDVGMTCCDGNCCNPSNCENCVNGECKVCGGDPDLFCCGGSCCHTNKKCCDGVCTEKCKNEEPSGHCNTSDNDRYKCQYCVPPGTGLDCSSFTTRIYTGNISHSCSGGCPGDCARQPDVHCYTEYKCVFKDGIEDWACIVFGDGELGCMGPDLYIFCMRCQKDPQDPGEKFYVQHHACK